MVNYQILDLGAWSLDFLFVISAQAGIQYFFWIPAFAEMTAKERRV